MLQAAPLVCAEESFPCDDDIARLAEDGWSAARKIWEWSEPGYQEENSSGLLADWLEGHQFRVKRGIAEIPTAFTAEYGSGKPVIAILGEFDALPGLSQAGVPYREPRPDSQYGHGCGHHLFGTASAMAAIAIARQIEAGRLSGTVRYYGCPAEEGGSAKVFIVRAGLFDDVDAAMHWHPSSMNAAGDRSTLARIAVKFRFHGTSAHAAGAPEQGRSALDAVELTNFAAQLLREHTPDGTRIHHVITAGGEAPNVVPAFSEVYYYIRHPKGHIVRELYARLVKCAKAGALGTETRLEIRNEGGILEILPNNALAEVTLDTLRKMNDLSYTEEERAFAIRIQETLAAPKPLESIEKVIDRSGDVGKGSTDVGDVSWVVPTTGFNTACWVPGTPGHSWQAVATGNTSIARKGMILAARVLAESTRTLMTSPEILKRAKKELARRLEDREYTPLMAPEQQPPLDYRRPTQRP